VDAASEAPVVGETGGDGGAGTTRLQWRHWAREFGEIAGGHFEEDQWVSTLQCSVQTAAVLIPVF